MNEPEANSWVHEVPNFKPSVKPEDATSQDHSDTNYSDDRNDRIISSGALTFLLIVSSGIASISATILFILGASFFQSFLVYAFGSVCLFMVILFFVFLIRRGRRALLHKSR